MDKDLLNKECENRLDKKDIIKTNTENEKASRTDQDCLELLFNNVADYCDDFYRMLMNYKNQLNQLPVFTRNRARKEFVKLIGLSIDEIEVLILEVNQLWKQIKRAINIRNLDKLEATLRTYTYHRSSVNRCLLAFENYQQELKQSRYVKDKGKKEALEGYSEELNVLAKDFNLCLEQVYSMVVLSD